MALTLKQLLMREEWSSSFGPRTLSRGKRYARQGRVGRIELSRGSDKDRMLLEGIIRGSGRNVYTCFIELASAHKELFIDAQCSCPVGVECKHAAAMLHAIAHGLVPGNHGAASAIFPGAREPRELADQSGWQRWEDWLAHPSGRAAAALTADAERQFGILLGACADGEYLRAEPVWMRPSRKKSGSGGLVDPQAMSLSEQFGPVPQPAGGWSSDEEDALSHLMHARIERRRNRDFHVASQPHVGRALEALLAHHPAYFERASAPLARGPDLRAKLQWREQDDGRQKLTLAQAERRHRLVLRAHDMWYIDTDRGRYGRIDGNPDVLAQVRKMPELPPGYVKKARRELRKSPLAATMPLPNLRKRGPDIAAPPTPVVRVETKRRPTFSRYEPEKLGLARLYFDYAGARVEAAESTPVMERLVDGRIHTIHGDRRAEAACARTLVARGFLPMEAIPEYRWVIAQGSDPWRYWLLAPDDRKPPLPPKAWSETLAGLSEKGFRIEYGPDFPRIRKVEIDAWHAELAPSGAGHAWFDVALGIDVEGERIDMLAPLRRLIADPKFPRRRQKGEKKNATWTLWLDEERQLELPRKRLRAMIEPLLEWLEGDKDSAPRVHGAALAALDESGIDWQGGKALRKQIHRLKRAREIRPPRALGTTLRPYQSDGLAWLNFLSDAGLGGILADDMGLGKTVQVLAHILTEKQRRRLKRPVLVVAPTSLVGNWASEAGRFTPTLKTLILHGSQRHRDFAKIPQHNLVITTYPLLPRDNARLAEHEWSLMVLDEAQAIKNARSRTARAVRAIPAARRIAMTGTPLENHLGELWAQFDAVEPGLLGGAKHFRRHYRTPIEKHGDSERQQQLNRRIGALLLRRRKDEVLRELPRKNDIVRPIELAGAQRQLYETLRLAQHRRVREAIAERGLAQSGIVVLDALLKLRQACCDPRLVKLESARKVKHSAKLDALMELLEGLVAEGRRALVFSQFTTMLELIRDALQKRGIEHQALTGKTPAQQRSRLVKRFQEGKVPAFLVSLKAGGVGLNLTAADTVIHYDPWWNPAVENQATDRAHRIGQKNPVFVYRLISSGTVEEKIQAMQAKKAELAKAVLEGGSSKKLRFDEQDLDALFGTRAD